MPSSIIYVAVMPFIVRFSFIKIQSTETRQEIISIHGVLASNYHSAPELLCEVRNDYER